VGFSWTTFFAEIVNFVLFLWLLQRMLYKPLQRAIAERREARRQAEERVAQMTERAAAMEVEQQRVRAEWGAERARILEQATAEAQQRGVAILERAEADALDTQRRGRERLELERREVELALSERSLSAARAALEALLRAMDLTELDTVLLDRLFAELGRTPPQQLSDVDQAELRCASELDNAERGAIERRLQDLLQRPLRLEVRSEPQLISGASLRLGDRLYDASLASRLDRVVAGARQRLGVDV